MNIEKIKRLTRKRVPDSSLSNHWHRLVGKAFRLRILGVLILVLLMAFPTGTTWAQGAGKALEFDGSDDYVNVPDDASLDITNTITIEAWGKEDSYSWSSELLTNPGFEDGNFNGWTTSGSNWEVGTNPESGSAGPQSGSYCAYNNASSSTKYIRQDVDVSAYATAIDAGNALCRASAWIVSSEYNVPVWDQSRIKIQYLTAAKAVISTPLDCGYQNLQNWTQYSITDNAIPVNTRYIRVWGNTYETDWDSGSLDNFSVKVGVLRGLLSKGTDAYSLRTDPAGTTLQGYLVIMK